MDYCTKTLNPKLCENISEKFHKQLIKLAVKSLNELEVDDAILLKLKEENNVTDEQLCDLVGMYITIINLFLCKDKEEFEEKLLTAGYPQSFIDNLPFNQTNRDVILSNVQRESNTTLDYKIDNSLSNNALKKVVPPWVIFNLKQDNRKICFSTDSATFHKLRFNLAQMLKELNSVKNMSIIKNK